jgi:uncharacterized protein (DUF2252 family)
MSSPKRLGAALSRGRAVRASLPRASLAEIGDRPAGFEPLAVLRADDGTRDPALLPLRYERMRADAFSFFRGSARLQASDLASGPSSPLEVQLCGDAHLSNFGVFASPERRIVFDANDFDETARGPFEWDVKRLAASAVVAARGLGLRSRDAAWVARAVGESYRRAIWNFAARSTLAMWYSVLDVDDTKRELRGTMDEPRRRAAARLLRSIREEPTTERFAQLIVAEPDGPRIASHPPLLVPLAELVSGESHRALDSFLRRIVSEYDQSLSLARRQLLARFAPVDVARKVVGIGSVGTRCFIVLLVGRDLGDPFILQLKEARASAVDVARGVKSTLAPAERVVEGQMMIQATPDPFLGWHAMTYPDDVARSFYVRQLYDEKGGVNLATLSAPSLTAYASACAWVLARAHARGGSAAEIAGYVGRSERFDEAIASYAHRYAARALGDHAELRQEGPATPTT